MRHPAIGSRFASRKLAIRLVEPERIEEAAPRHSFMSFTTIKRTLEPFPIPIKNPALGV
jgi:hypothetical protein